jgi:putative heme-binding domain-containing protein
LDEEGLFETIQNGIAGADMPPTKLAEAKIWQIVAFVRSLTAPALETAPPGDLRGGEALFWGKAECGSCHRIRGKGGMLGPDLSNIGAQRPVDRLRQAILDPDGDGFRGYTAVVATLKDGRVLRGVARNRTNYSVQILDEQGQLHLLEMPELRTVELGKHSPMPGDYKQRLSRQEITDLVAFLSRQSVRPYEPQKKTTESGENH